MNDSLLERPLLPHLSPSQSMRGGKEQRQPEGAGSFLQAQLSGHFLLAAEATVRRAGALLISGVGLGGVRLLSSFPGA